MQATAPGETVPFFYGATLPPGRVQSILVQLDHNAAKGSPEGRTAFRLLARHLRAALLKTPEGVSVINADANVAPEKVRAAEAEEAFHRAMFRATAGGLAEGEAGAYLRSSASTEEAAQRVQQARPYLAGDAEVAEEIAAMLSGGEWDKLGLSALEAADAWYRFGTMMSNGYGEPGREILKYGHILHSSAGDRVREEAAGAVEGTNPSSPTRADKGPGPRYRFAAVGAGSPQFERIDPAKALYSELQK
jgi:hypothetical protein